MEAMEVVTTFTVAALGPFVGFLESLSFLGVQSHFIKSEYLDAQVQVVADSVGMELTLIKYTLSLFAVYPLAALLYTLPGKSLKHLFSFLVGFSMVQWIFGPDWIHTFVASLGAYVLCALLPKKTQPWVTFWFVMGYMVISHAYRMYVSYMSGTFDFTGTQMVLTMKLTSFAYNLYDGTADDKNVFPTVPHENKFKAKMYADRAKFAIRSLPNPLEFFGYVYCFTCILAGPAFEYRDYEKAIDGSAYTTADGKVKKPTAVLAGLYRLLVGVACLALHMTISPLFPVKSLYDRGLLATLTYPALFGRLTMSMISDRMKFYFAWKVAEGASIMGGFGFEGYTKEGKVVGWKGVENIDILGVETASSITVLLRHWNKRTQGWLERYTYARSGRSLVATYFISALWHGLYPGFFLMFYMLAFLTTIDRLLKAKLNPLFVPGFDGRDMSTYPKGMGGSVYWLLCIAGTQVFNNYGAQAFSMGSLENSLTAFGGHYFVPHIILLSIYLLLIVVPGPKKSAKKE